MDLTDHIYVIAYTSLNIYVPHQLFEICVKIILDKKT